LISATLLTLIIFPVIIHGVYRKKYVENGHDRPDVA